MSSTVFVLFFYHYFLMTRWPCCSHMATFQNFSTFKAEPNFQHCFCVSQEQSKTSRLLWLWACLFWGASAADGSTSLPEADLHRNVSNSYSDAVSESVSLAPLWKARLYEKCKSMHKKYGAAVASERNRFHLFLVVTCRHEQDWAGSPSPKIPYESE